MFKNLMNFSKFSKFSNVKVFNKSSSFGFKTVSNSGSKSNRLGYMLLGTGTVGLSYLTYHLHKESAQHTKNLLFSSSVSSHISKQRTKDTLGYFAGGLILTSGLAFGMLRSPRLLAYSGNLWSLLFTLPASFFFMYKARTTEPSNVVAKHLYMGGFNAVMAFNLLPLVAFTELVILRDAMLLTSGCFGGLGYTAYMSRDDAFIGMGGLLGAGLGGLVAVSLGNIFFQSPILFNVWLYGGMALFLGLTLYDLKEVQIRANKSYNFDPMGESIKMYLDFINIFVRMVMILQNRKK
jgi:FtsH-binding integral membrane protein